MNEQLVPFKFLFFKLLDIKSYYVSEITLDIGNNKLLWQKNEQLVFSDQVQFFSWSPHFEIP